MNTIPEASEARVASLKNPSFERKVELYNQVVETINKAVEEGKDSFSVTEEQFHALHKEILEKGYKEYRSTGSALVNQILFNVSTISLVVSGDKESPYKTYYFN